MAPQSKGRTYREVVDEAVNWFAENGFTSEEDLRYWEERISRAADAAIDLVIVRELTGDVYFGAKGRRETAEGAREGGLDF